MDTFSEIQSLQTRLSTVWPQWKITRKLGRGTYGNVYEILRDDLGVDYRCALKVLQMDTFDLPDSQDNSSSSKREMTFDLDLGQKSFSDRGECEEEQIRVSKYSDACGQKGKTFEEDVIFPKEKVLEDFVRTVSREIDAMMQLKGMPNIVTIEDYAVLKSRQSRTILIRMEILESLDQIVKHNHTLDVKEVLRLGMDICNALSCCEQRNMIHRDIKPSNLFYNRQLGYKLGDFGISRTMNSIYEKNYMTGIGVPQYMAPEVYFGREYNNTIDIYSLGLTLYVLLNDNLPPFCEASERQSMSDIRNANFRRLNGEKLPFPKHADKYVSEVICRACSPDPMLRYQTAEEFRVALESCYKNRKPKSGFLQLKKHWIPVICILSLVVALGLAVIHHIVIHHDVNYTVICKDINGTTIYKEVLQGNAGREIYVNAPAIDGYTAQDDTISLILDGDSSKNNYEFIYEKDPRVIWTNNSLEMAVRNFTGLSGDITLKKAQEVKNLKLEKMNLSDISDLRQFKGLTGLSLAGNSISDLNFLSDLNSLTELDLEDNNITDITALGNLSSLQTLNLSENSLEDVSALAKLKSLEKLSLVGTKVRDLNPLEGIRSLSFLDVRYCPVDNVSCLRRMREEQGTEIVSADPDMNIPRDAIVIAGHSYYLFDNDCKNWEEVLEYCHKRGGYPAVINNSEENEELYQYMLRQKRNAALFGYSDWETEGIWKWVDERTSDFTDWGTNKNGVKEPNATEVTEDYAQMDENMKNGHWNDSTFAKGTSSYICEWDGFR